MTNSGLVWFDYVIIFTYLGLVVGFGSLFYRQQKSTEDFFLGGRSIGWFPIGISIMASLFSAITLMGSPAEYFTHNIELYLFHTAVLLVAPLILFVFMPFYHKLKVVSAYEYLERRFNLPVRLLASGIFIFWRLCWMATAVYVPSLVLSVVTGLPLISMILVMGILATFYTTLGGMKAVIWTDVIQAVVLWGGIGMTIFILIKSMPNGAADIWQIAKAAGRTQLLDFQFSFTNRVTFWGLLVGPFFVLCSFYGADQVTLQRYFSSRSLKDSRRSFLLNIVLVMIVNATLVVIGLGLFAFYQKNPQLLDANFQGDKVFPYFIAHQLPAGISGLMLAAIYAAAMSSIDSGINTVTTAYITDFHKRLNLFNPNRVAVSDREILRLARILTFIIGAVITTLACFVGQLGSIIEITNKIVNSFSGPLISIFILGMLTRRATPYAVMTASITGTVLTVYAIFFTPISFLWYPAIGGFFTLIIGYSLSFFENKPAETKLQGLVWRFSGKN